jgi:type IV pilus assembly protein PilW
MKNKNNERLARGVSLIELMVALTIGSLLIIGAVTVYTQSRTTYRINETVSRMQENARYALSMMEPDIRLANHWGLMSDPLLIAGTVGNMPLAVPAGAQSCGANFAIDLRLPVDGENGAYALGCPVDATGVAAQANSDTLILRRASTDAVAADDTRLQIYTTRQGGSSRVFQGAAAPGPIVNDPLYGPSAEVRNLIVRAYYVTRQSSLGPTVPALRRKTLEGGAALGPHFDDEEIMPGIEDMQVEFGLDTGADLNGDGVPDDSDGNGQPDFYTGVATRYVSPGDPLVDGNPANGEAVVCTVRIWLRVRAEQPEVGYQDTRTYSYGSVVNFTPNDNFRRLLVSRTIQIRNTQT